MKNKLKLLILSLIFVPYNYSTEKPVQLAEDEDWSTLYFKITDLERQKREFDNQIMNLEQQKREIDNQIKYIREVLNPLATEKKKSEIHRLASLFGEIALYEKGEKPHGIVTSRIQEFISNHPDWKKNLEKFYPNKKESIEKWVSENIQLKKTEEKESTPPGGAKI